MDQKGPHAPQKTQAEDENNTHAPPPDVQCPEPHDEDEPAEGQACDAK